MANWIIGIPLITLFASTALAVLVIPSSRGERGRTTLNFLLAIITIWSFMSFMLHSVDFPSTIFWTNGVLACGALTSAAGVHFAVRFAEAKGKFIRVLLVILYSLGACFLMATIAGILVEESTLLPGGAVEIRFALIMTVSWIYIMCTILAAIAILVNMVRTHAKTTDKKYILAPIAGYITMSLGGLSNLVVSGYPVDIAANFFFVALITYGVVGRHLLKPQLRQTWTVHLQVIFLVALSYSALVVFCQVWLGFNLFTSHFIGGLTSLFFFVSTYQYSRTFISHTVIKGLFPVISRFQSALNRIYSVDMSLPNWDQSVKDTLEMILQATHAKNAALLLVNDQNKCFETRFVVGPAQTDLFGFALPNESMIVTTLNKAMSGLSVEEIEQTPGISTEETIRLKALNLNLLCNVRAHDKTLGILITRHAKSGLYEQEEKDFLWLVSNQLALGIQNTLIYESEKRYRLFAENLTDVIWTEDLNLRFTYVSPSITRMLGYTPEEWILLTPDAYSTPGSMNIVRQALTEELALEASGQGNPDRTRIFQVEARRKDGSTLWVEIKISFLRISGHPTEIIGVVRTITERKQAEEALKRSQEELRNLSAHLEAARENERTSIARELHDELGQALTALRMDLMWVKGRLSGELTALTTKMELMIELVDDTGKQVKEISSQLRPGILDDFGLTAAIEWATKQFTNRTSIPCKVTFEPEDIFIEKDLSTSIFRIFQEGLTNITRYAEATSVAVKLKRDEGQIWFSVEDNGKGMTPEQITSPKSLGLIGMRERVRFWGGIISINSVLGNGTSIVIKIPLCREGRANVKDTYRR